MPILLFVLASNNALHLDHWGLMRVVGASAIYAQATLGGLRICMFPDPHAADGLLSKL